MNPQDSIIDEIRLKMANHLEARIEYAESSVTYYPKTQDGFIVRLIVKKTVVGEQYIIYYNGSYETTSRRAPAITMFAFGLSSDCRLQEYSRCGKAYRWIVENWNPKTNQWDPDWDVVSYFDLVLRFWARPKVRYLQNRVIDLQNEGASSPAQL